MKCERFCGSFLKKMIRCPPKPRDCNPGAGCVRRPRRVPQAVALGRQCFEREGCTRTVRPPLWATVVGHSCGRRRYWRPRCIGRRCGQRCRVGPAALGAGPPFQRRALDRVGQRSKASLSHPASLRHPHAPCCGWMARPSVLESTLLSAFRYASALASMMSVLTPLPW